MINRCIDHYRNIPCKIWPIAILCPSPKEIGKWGEQRGLARWGRGRDKAMNHYLRVLHNYVSKYHEISDVALLFHSFAGSGIVLRVLSFEQGIVSLLNQF